MKALGHFFVTVPNKDFIPSLKVVFNNKFTFFVQKRLSVF